MRNLALHKDEFRCPFRFHKSEFLAQSIQRSRGRRWNKRFYMIEPEFRKKPLQPWSNRFYFLDCGRTPMVHLEMEKRASFIKFNAHPAILIVY